MGRDFPSDNFHSERYFLDNLRIHLKRTTRTILIKFKIYDLKETYYYEICNSITENINVLKIILRRKQY